MAKKHRIGIECMNPYVPNKVWDIFKNDLRKIFKIAFPEFKFSITEFYWQDFDYSKEYIRIIPKSEGAVDWKKVWETLEFTANEFGMSIEFLYQEEPVFKCLKEDTLFERKYASYSLKNIRTWTKSELDEFVETHSFEELKAKYYEV